MTPLDQTVSASQASGRQALSENPSPDSRSVLWPAVMVLAAAFLVRLYEAWAYFFDPDEALHNLLASQASFGMAYKAAGTLAHPPLLILVLYYWRALGHSELILRLPSVLAGTACCWLAYLWMKDVTDRATAFIGLLLFAFAPALVALSAEIRQYAFLIFFISACLYLSERALRQNSLALMILFALSLYGALLSHYSALFFAATMGVYMPARMRPYRTRVRLFAAWGIGQAGGVALSGYFVIHHLVRLRQAGMMSADFDTYLRRSIFHPAERNFASFAAVQTLRVFTVLFNHGIVGSLALLAFLLGMFLLLCGLRPGAAAPADGRPSPRELALLFALPFVMNCGAALAGQYPYGATRHSASLFLFAVCGISIGLASWPRLRGWGMYAGIALALLVCNVFPAPPPPIRARNQARSLMKAAVDFFWQAAAPGSVVVADYESGLLFGYYACGHGVVQTIPPMQAFARSDCGAYTVITTTPELWKFYASEFRGQVAGMANSYGLPAGTKVWLFDAGWITDSSPALRVQLQSLGCQSPQPFGENILICQIAVPAINGNGEGTSAQRIEEWASEESRD